jgi:hypothetical protein
MGADFPLPFLYGFSFFGDNTSKRRGLNMVKGTSRQVIVVHSPDPKLFEQAIFILKNEAVEQGVTDEALLKEAEQAIQGSGRRRRLYLYGPVWAIGGAAVTAIVWLVTTIL